MAKSVTILKFTPKSSDARRNYDDFIYAAKRLPFHASAKFDWNGNKWNLEGFAKPERPGASITLNFLKVPDCFRDFMKAIICFLMAETIGNPKQIMKFRKPLRLYPLVLNEALENGIDDVCCLAPEHFEEVIDGINSNPKMKPYTKAQNLQVILRLHAALEQYDLLATPFQWTHNTHGSYRKQRNLTKAAPNKALSADELKCVTTAFNQASSDQEKLYSSILALTCCAPMRIQEVLELPVDCDVLLNPGDGYQSGLRWKPKKSGKWQVKYVPQAMIPVAQKALERIKAITDPARHHLLKKLEENDIPLEQDRLVSNGSFVHWHEALFLLGPTISDGGYFGVRMLSYHSVLGKFTKTGETQTLWAMMNIKLPDGTYPEINTHKPRHYLHTLASKHAMPEFDKALWSGRANIHQNVTYDGETASEQSAKIAAKMRNGGRSIKITNRSDFDVAQIKESAHVTHVGYCLQSLRSQSCEMFGSCLDCTHLVCMKGADEKLESIKFELEITQKTLRNARDKQAAGMKIASIWIERDEKKVARLTQLISVLEDPRVVDGSLISMSDFPNLPQFDPIEKRRKGLSQKATALVEVKR